MGKLFALFQNAYFLVLQEEMDWTQISSLSLLVLPVTKKYISQNFPKIWEAAMMNINYLYKKMKVRNFFRNSRKIFKWKHLPI